MNVRNEKEDVNTVYLCINATCMHTDYYYYYWHFHYSPQAYQEGKLF